MDQELENKLINKYPRLFAGCKKPKNESLMYYGFEHGDGWYSIIDKLCENITKAGLDNIEFGQIKEKFGTLRIYVDYHLDSNKISDSDRKVITGLISDAEVESASICERCGAEEATMRRGGWLHTYCDKCQEEYECQKG